MKQEQMFDSYSVVTSDFGTAYEFLDEFSKSLEVVSMYTRDIRLVSFISEEPDGTFVVSVSTPPDPKSATFGGKIGFPKVYRLERNSFTLGGKLSDHFIDEFKKNGYVLSIDKKTYICSAVTLGTLCTRCSIAGEGILSGTSPMRDALIGELLYQRSSKCTLVMRKSDDGIKKIFSVLGSAYAPIKQTVIKDIIAESEKILGMKATLKKFTADNFITRAYIEFPDKAEDFSRTYHLKGDNVFPGVCISTSDIGDSSLTVWGTIRIGNIESPVFCGEYSRKHSGEIKLDEIGEKINQNIFDEYEAIPKRLVELLKIEVTDPKVVITAACKEAGFNKILGKNETKDFIEALSAEFTDVVTYTAYDIATGLVSAADRVKGLSENTLLLFRKNIKEAIFVNYEDIISRLKSGVYLIA